MQNEKVSYMVMVMDMVMDHMVYLLYIVIVVKLYSYTIPGTV